jgi:hypothetical protein
MSIPYENWTNDHWALTIVVINLWIHAYLILTINLNNEVVMLEDSRHATLRVYGELTAFGLSDTQAFRSAVSVFRYRLPGVSMDDAAFVVADWISAAQDR